jgi:hypothetical protein
VLYQVGLVYERLRQPLRAAEAYDRILGRQSEVATNDPPPGLATVLDMAKWRKSYLSWQTNAEVLTQSLLLSSAATNTPVRTP